MTFRTLLCLGLLITVQPARAVEYLNGIKWKKPPVVQPGQDDRDPPSDATVLFDGSNMDAWDNGEQWQVKDGVVTVGKGAITSKQKFGDCQLHIEWSSPDPPAGSGQGCGNSGIFLMGRYEIQVLDSYSSDTYHDGQAGAIYKQTPPAVNAMRKPGEWNTYDIFWTCPRFNDQGELISPAYITAVHNGVLILNHFALQGDTPYHRPPEYKAHPPEGPISIQDHGNPVRFRNIWIRDFTPAEGKQAREPYLRDGDKQIPLTEKQTMHGEWKLKTIDGDELPTGVDIPELTITSDGTVSGHTSVNRLMGKLSAAGKAGPLFGTLATTRRAGSPVAMQLEQRYTDALGKADSFKIDATELHLLAGGELVMVLEAMH